MNFPRAHATFLARAVPALDRDHRFRALLLAGSAATGGMDRWSDLDTILVVEDGALAAVWDEHMEVLGRLGPLLTAFGADHIAEARLLLCLYDAPLLQVDVKLVAESDVAALTMPAIVHWSRGPAPALPRPAPPRAFDVQWCADRLAAWSHYLAIRLGRGELFEVANSLDFLRVRVLAPLIALEAGATPRGLRRLEDLDSPRLAALARTLAPYDRAALAEAARAAMALAMSLLDGHPEIRRQAVAEATATAFLAEVTATP